MPRYVRRSNSPQTRGYASPVKDMNSRIMNLPLLLKIPIFPDHMMKRGCCVTME